MMVELRSHKPGRILCADDDPIIREILRAVLTKLGYDVIVACDGQEAWEGLFNADAPRLAVLDWMMPRMDGLEIVKKVREEKPEPYTYIILLTARFSKSDIVGGINAGADDYIIKPFDPHELTARIQAGGRILDLQAQLLSAEAKLRHQATHDELTDLYNRGAIMEHLDRELDHGRRSKESVAAMILDLDDFKSVNDAHGHRVGDEVLREASRRMCLAVRNYDAIGRLVGRYGGEEFLIILRGAGESDAYRVAERVRDAIARTPIDCQGGLQVPVTASLGVAVTESERPADSDTLIAAADLSLYRAKEAGRNQVQAAAALDFKSS